MNKIEHLNARNAALLSLLIFALLHIGCEGTDVVLELLSVDSDGADHDHWGDSDTDTADTSSSQSGEDDLTDCGDAVWEDNVWIDYGPELKALEGVTHITGSLQIQRIEEDCLEYLEALRDLRCVDRNFDIENNDGIVDLDIFSNLHTVGGNLFIENNRALENLDGIRNIQNLVGNVLYITDNDSLPTCTARDLYNEFSDLGWEGYACIVNNNHDDCNSISRGCIDEYLRY